MRNVLWITVSVLLVALSSVAFAQTDPNVPGFIIETYADLDGFDLDKPTRMTFDPDGNLYVGAGDAVTTAGIYVVRPGDPPRIVEVYGTGPVHDPDTVLFDEFGFFTIYVDDVPTSTAGGVLTGGYYNPSQTEGIIEVILPDESVHTVCGPTTLYTDPMEMLFDRTGRFLLSDHGTCPSVLFSDNGECPEDFADPNLFKTVRAADMAVDDLNRIWTLSAVDGIIRCRTEDGSAWLDDEFATGFSGHIPLMIGPGGAWGSDLYTCFQGELWRYTDPEPDLDAHPTRLAPDEIVGTGFSTHDFSMEFGPDGALYVRPYNEYRILRIQADCNGNGIPDDQDIANCDPNDPNCADCNENGIPDECDITDGMETDLNGNGVPDDCECLGDLNGDGAVNLMDLAILLARYGATCYE